MASVALITGATGGLGMEFTRVINSYSDIDEIWAIGRNTEKLETIKSKYKKVVPICADLAADGGEVIKRKIE